MFTLMTQNGKAALRAAVLGALLLTSSAGHAMPALGAELPSAHVADADDRSFNLVGARGRPILVVYEDKDSADVNVAFKAELSHWANKGQYRTVVQLVPVADVRSYDFWPVRGFVKDAIRKESRKQNTTIYCDWNGDFARNLSLQPGTSNIVLFGRNGRVLFAKAGRLSPDEIQRVIHLLRAEVDTVAS